MQAYGNTNLWSELLYVIELTATNTMYLVSLHLNLDETVLLAFVSLEWCSKIATLHLLQIQNISQLSVISVLSSANVKSLLSLFLRPLSLHEYS